MDITFEVFVFLEACVLGIVFGAFYDVFRILRLSFKNSKFLVFIEDVLYFSTITLASFIFIVVGNNGYLRSFLIIGELLGAILYFFTASVVIIKSANLIIKITKNFFNFFYKITLRPIIKLFCYIKAELKRFIVKYRSKIKNIIQKCKIHLK